MTHLRAPTIATTNLGRPSASESPATGEPRVGRVIPRPQAVRDHPSLPPLEVGRQPPPAREPVAVRPIRLPLGCFLSVDCRSVR